MRINKKQILQALAATLVLTSASVSAREVVDDTWFGEQANGQWMAGVKVGSINSGDRGFNSAKTAAALVGYQFARPIGEQGSASIEFELGQSSEGDVNSGQQSYQWDTENSAVYLNYRSPGKVYYKVKGGFSRNEINQSTVADSTSHSSTDFSYGVGLGLRTGPEHNVQLEAEWVSTGGDANISQYSVGAAVLF